MNLAEWLARTARITPDAPALFHGTQQMATYGEFGARSAAIAGALQRDYGVARGDRVAIFMKNRTEYLEASYGIWWSGAAAIPINAKLHPKEAAWIIENAQATAVFISDDVGEDLIREIDQTNTKVISVDQDSFQHMLKAEPLAEPVPIDAQDMVWLFYTSGTTGRPKGDDVLAKHPEHDVRLLCRHRHAHARRRHALRSSHVSWCRDLQLHARCGRWQTRLSGLRRI